MQQVDLSDFPYRTYQDLAAEPDKLTIFVIRFWQEIVDARRRVLRMLQSTYWTNFEKGWTSHVNIHFEVVETCLDKIRRCPLNCPDESEWDEYSINSWPLLQPMLEPKWWMSPMNTILKKIGLKDTSRRMRYKHFEFVLDSVNSFRRAHIRLMENLYKKSQASWEVLDDPISAQHHALNPLVLLLVREEVFDALRMADDFYRDMVSGNRDYMISSASKSVVRHLLKDIESNVKHEFESGEIDANEETMMRKVIQTYVLSHLSLNIYIYIYLNSNSSHTHIQ